MKAAILAIAAMATTAGSVNSCNPEAQPSAVEQQRYQAAREAAAEQTYCYECQNIKNRRILFGKPGVIGYVLFLNDAGQPIQYLSVKGKCTSSGKRLTPTDIVTNGRMSSDPEAYGENNVVRAAVGEDGTFGSSENYVYCWTTDGRYVQWSGQYLYSDKPFDLTIKPLIIAISPR